MDLGRIEIEGTGLTKGHPPVIISGKIKEGSVCKINGLLSLDKTTGEFEPYNFTTPGGYARIALDDISASTTTARVLLHGTFNADEAVKANGDKLSAAELAAVQENGQIYFV
jgi:hypothetical protein